MKNEKNKAQEIHSNFYAELLQTDSDVSEEVIISSLAKRCSIILCDSHINEFKAYSGVDSMSYSHVQFWTNVKQIISDEL